MPVQFVIVQGKPAGKTLTFPRGEYLFGRGTECHIRPNSDWVSRQHCLLRVTPREVTLRDLGSRNGTLVNGIRLVQERVLQDGDRVEIGPLVFQVFINPTTEAKAPSKPIPLGPAKPKTSPTEATQDQTTFQSKDEG